MNAVINYVFGWQSIPKSFLICSMDLLWPEEWVGAQEKIRFCLGYERYDMIIIIHDLTFLWVLESW
jgi:hypothetical protein